MAKFPERYQWSTGVHFSDASVEQACPSKAGTSKSIDNATANLRTGILDFTGFDSIIILVLGGGILMSIVMFPGKFESTHLSRDTLVGRLGVLVASW